MNFPIFILSGGYTSRTARVNIPNESLRASVRYNLVKKKHADLKVHLVWEYIKWPLFKEFFSVDFFLFSSVPSFNFHIRF